MSTILNGCLCWRPFINNPFLQLDWYLRLPQFSSGVMLSSGKQTLLKWLILWLRIENLCSNCLPRQHPEVPSVQHWLKDYFNPVMQWLSSVLKKLIMDWHFSLVFTNVSMAMEIASSKGRLQGGGGSHGSTFSPILVIWSFLLIWLIRSPFFWPAQITNKNPWMRTMNRVLSEDLNARLGARPLVLTESPLWGLSQTWCKGLCVLV